MINHQNLLKFSQINKVNLEAIYHLNVTAPISAKADKYKPFSYINIYLSRNIKNLI